MGFGFGASGFRQPSFTNITNITNINNIGNSGRGFGLDLSSFLLGFLTGGGGAGGLGVDNFFLQFLRNFGSSFQAPLEQLPMTPHHKVWGTSANKIDDRHANAETGRYKVDASKDGADIWVTDKQTGKKQHIWGDPHLVGADGKNLDIKGPFTMLMPDGKTRITVNTAYADGAPWDPNDKTGRPTYAKKISIGNDDEGVSQIDNIIGKDPISVSRVPAGPWCDKYLQCSGAMLGVNGQGQFINPNTGAPLTQADVNLLDTQTADRGKLAQQMIDQGADPTGDIMMAALSGSATAVTQARQKAQEALMSLLDVGQSLQNQGYSNFASSIPQVDPNGTLIGMLQLLMGGNRNAYGSAYGMY